MDNRWIPAFDDTKQTRCSHLCPAFVAFQSRDSEESGSLQADVQGVTGEGEKVGNDSSQQVGTGNLS